MRKTYFVILGIFVTVSLLFYTPVRNFLFKREVPSFHTSRQKSKVVALLTDYFGPLQGKTLIGCLPADSARDFQNSLFFQDSLTELYAPCADVADRELIFKTSILVPRGEKEVRFLARPANDQAKIICYSDTGKTVIPLSVKEGMQLISFNPGKSEFLQFGIEISGRVKLTRPQLFAMVKKNSTKAAVPLLIADLPPDLISSLKQKLPSAVWSFNNLIPSAYQPDLFLSSLLTGEAPSNYATLPQQYAGLLATAATASGQNGLSGRSENSLSLLLGVLDSTSRKISRRNHFDFCLLIDRKQLEFGQLGQLAVGALSSFGHTVCMYLQIEGISVDEPAVFFQTSIKNISDLTAVILSSNNKVRTKAPVLLAKNRRPLQFGGNSVLELSKLLAGQQDLADTDSLPESILYEDSTVYFWGSDSIMQVDLAADFLQGSYYSAEGKKLSEQNYLSSRQRELIYQTGKRFVKILTLINRSSVAVNRQLTVNSDRNFICFERSKAQRVSSRSFMLQLAPGAVVQLVIHYEIPNQQFTYNSRDKLSAVYGAVGLPIKDLNDFRETSVLTAAGVRAGYSKKYDLQIENFAILPIWRYWKLQ